MLNVTPRVKGEYKSNFERRIAKSEELLTKPQKEVEEEVLLKTLNAVMKGVD